MKEKCQSCYKMSFKRRQLIEISKGVEKKKWEKKHERRLLMEKCGVILIDERV